jgi:hypothetical protein
LVESLQQIGFSRVLFHNFQKQKTRNVSKNKIFETLRVFFPMGIFLVFFLLNFSAPVSK